MELSEHRFAATSKWLALLVVTAMVSACGGGGGGSDSTPPANRVPVANAGADRTVAELSNVSLDGSGSTDSDGSIVSYAWSQVGGTAVSLTGATTATPSFSSPDVSDPTELTFELVVTDNDGAASAADRVVFTVVEVGPTVTVTGRITFDLVPRNPATGGLDYANTVATPAAGIRVQAVDASNRTTVLAIADTDNSGNYSMTVPSVTDMYVRGRAEMLKSGPAGWDFTVVDNNGLDNTGVVKPVYAVISEDFNTDVSNWTVTVHAASGWDGSSYSQPRAAAPFSILYAVKMAVDMVVQADPNASFPPLALNWSVNNTVDGEVGTSYYDGEEIYLLGEANVDTEEFDHAVIVHEWGHYFEDVFSRSDSVGGSHSGGDILDPRVAFGEGFGNAFQAMARGNSLYFDTNSSRQSSGFSFDVESNCTSAQWLPRGWFSECSVQSMLYDLFDSANDGPDTLSMGFTPIYDVLIGAQMATQSLTTVHSFSTFLRAQNAASLAGIDTLLDYHAIVSGNTAGTVTEWGDGEDNYASSRNTGLDAEVKNSILPIYKDGLTLTTPVSVCVGVDPAEGDYNKLGNRQFIRFRVPTTGGYQITATNTFIEPGLTVTPDPDMVLYDQGPTHYAFDASNPAQSPVTESFCTTVPPNPDYPVFDFGPCSGGLLPLQANVDYVLEVQDDNNLSYDLDAAHLGKYCMDIVLSNP